MRETIKWVFGDYDEYYSYLKNDVYTMDWFYSGLLSHLRKILEDGIGDDDFINTFTTEISHRFLCIVFGGPKNKGESSHLEYIVGNIDYENIKAHEYAYIELGNNRWVEIDKSKKVIGTFINILRILLLEPQNVYTNYDAYLNKFTKKYPANYFELNMENK